MKLAESNSRPAHFTVVERACAALGGLKVSMEWARLLQKQE